MNTTNATAAAGIRVIGACKTYRSRRSERRALDGMNLEIEGGQWMALLGPNGSGKSTLLRILATLESLDEGEVAVAGHNLAQGDQGQVRAMLGVVFQNPGLDRLLTVKENLVIQGALFGQSKSDATDRARKLAALFEISDRLGERVGSLSGGLARRTDLARALMSNPGLLLLDEPTTGLDHDSRMKFLSLIDALRSNRSEMTIVMSTHLMDEAQRADQVALVSEGKIAAVGSPIELRQKFGAQVVTTSLDSADVLESDGLEVRRTNREAIGSGSLESVERGCAALVRAGAAFSVGPATLSDVYLAHTGAELDSEGRA